jgi:hypothetical protein
MALFIGERHQIGDDADKWFAPLSISASRSAAETLLNLAVPAMCLDGPLSALKHLVRLLASDQHNPPVAAGEIITTGTLTKAMPVKRGAVGHRIERIRSTGSISVSTDSQYFLEAVASASAAAIGSHSSGGSLSERRNISSRVKDEPEEIVAHVVMRHDGFG